MPRSPRPYGDTQNVRARWPNKTLAYASFCLSVPLMKPFNIKWIVFYPRDAKLAHYWLWACASSTVSVSVSVISRYCIETAERNQLVSWHRGIFYTELFFIEFRVYPKVKILPCWALFQSLDLEILMSPRHIDRSKCCQLSSTDDRRQLITLRASAFVYSTMGVTQRVARVTVHLRQLKLYQTVKKIYNTKDSDVFYIISVQWLSWVGRKLAKSYCFHYQMNTSSAVEIPEFKNPRRRKVDILKIAISRAWKSWQYFLTDNVSLESTVHWLSENTVNFEVDDAVYFEISCYNYHYHY